MRREVLSPSVLELQEVGDDSEEICAGCLRFDDVAFGAFAPEENELVVVIEEQCGNAADAHAFRHGGWTESRLPELVARPECRVIEDRR